MMGYVTKHVSHVYNGDSVSMYNLCNGMFVSVSDGDAHLKPGGATTFKTIEKTTLWGKPALVLEVVELYEDLSYFVENEFDVSSNAEWDESNYIIPKGTPLRIKRLLPGEQIIRTVNDTLFDRMVNGAYLSIADFASIDAALHMQINS